MIVAFQSAPKCCRQIEVLAAMVHLETLSWKENLNQELWGVFYKSLSPITWWTLQRNATW